MIVGKVCAVIAAAAMSLVLTCPVRATNSASPTAQAENALPRPTPAFKGKIGKTYKDSVADFPQPLKAPKGAPNVVVILLDDVGFGHPGTFGGPIPTPNLDKLASEGLRYNTFHTTGICSPTRAAVLTGLNHHQVGFGTIAELSTGFPGYDSVWPLEATTVAEVLEGKRLQHGGLGQVAQYARLGDDADRARSRAGRPARALNIGTDSTAAKPASGSRNSSATKRRSSRRKRRNRDTI